MVEVDAHHRTLLTPAVDRVTVRLGDGLVHIGLPRQRVVAGEVGGGQLGLRLDDRQGRTGGLHESHERQRRVGGVEHALVQRHCLGVVTEPVLAQERNGDAVAGGPHDDVDLLDRTVGEHHAVAVEAFDAAHRPDLAVGDAVQDRVGDGRVVLEQPERRLEQAVVLRFAHRETEHRLRDDLAYLPRQHRKRTVGGVGGPAEEVLGHDVGAVPGAEHHVVGDVRSVDCDVHGGVAHADDQDALVAERLGLAVVVGVHLLTVEPTRVLRVRPARVPVVAVGHDDPVEFEDLAVIGGDGPAILVALDGRDGGVEEVLLGDTEVVGVVLQVAGDLLRRGVVLPLRGHRVVGELGAALGRVQVQRLVGRGKTAGVLVDPEATDAVTLLETDDIHTALDEFLHRGDACCTPSDNADAGGRCGGRSHAKVLSEQGGL